jgi:hypothetical protein
LRKKSLHFPNLEELLFRTVLAFPNDSKIGLANKILVSTLLLEPATSAKYCKACFVHSVLLEKSKKLNFQIYLLVNCPSRLGFEREINTHPAPDSPEIMRDCDLLCSIRAVYALSANVNT